MEVEAFHLQCMGSDYPFPLGEHHPGKLIESMSFPQEMKDGLLFDNALSWLNLDKEKYTN